MAMTEIGSHMGAVAMIVTAVKHSGTDEPMTWLKERGCPVDGTASGQWWEQNFDTVKNHMLMKQWLPSEE